MLVDSHAHLLRLEISPEEAVKGAAEAGVGAVVNIGTDVDDSQRGAELAAALPNVYTSVGIHPHNAGTYTAGRPVEYQMAVSETISTAPYQLLTVIGVQFVFESSSTAERWRKRCQDPYYHGR